MKVDDITPSIEDSVRMAKDEHMSRYIREVKQIKYMPLRHNNNKTEQMYIVPRHERSGMLYGNILYIEYIGELMKRDFGHNYRAESLYTTFFGDNQYGDSSYIVLPFGGDYTLCYSEDVHDMYHVVPKLKIESYEEVYHEIKNNVDKEVLSVWNDMEYDVIHEMKLSLDDYRNYMIKKGLTTDMIDKLLRMFSDKMMNKYNKLISQYKKTNSLVDAYSDVGRMYHPMIEVMIDAPKFLMVSYSYIMKKYGNVDYFFDALLGAE